MTQNEHNDIELYARMLALQAGLVAVLRTSQSQDLPSVLEREIEKVRSILLANSISDECISAFEQQLVPIQKAVR
jgi:hypothetical protein